MTGSGAAVGGNLFSGVCAALAHAGFEAASSDGRVPGLYVRHQAGGVVIGWSTGDGLSAVSRVQPRVGSGEGNSAEAAVEYHGIRQALRLALAVILQRSGFDFVEDPGSGEILVAGRRDQPGAGAAAPG